MCLMADFVIFLNCVYFFKLVKLAALQTHVTGMVIKGAWEKTVYFPWNSDKFLNHKYVRHELYVDEHGNPMVELDSKSDKINTFLQQLDMNIKKLNDAGFNGDVFAIVS